MSYSSILIIDYTSFITSLHMLDKGTTINDLGWGRRKSRKKILEALLQEKINFRRHSPGKKILRGLAEEKIKFGRPCRGNFLYGRGSREKINSF